MRNIQFLFRALIILFIIPSVSAAHYIVGEVYDALDSTSANGRIVTIWNPNVGIQDNLTDIIGTGGNSGIDNVYFVDCEMLNTSCQIDDIISVKVFDNGDGYATKIANVTITGAGYDISPNLTIASQINFLNISLDDSYNDELDEIDLIPASTVETFCQGIVYGDYMDSEITSIASSIFSNESSFYSDSDQNNKHYTNNSCSINTSYGNSDQVYFNCSYSMQYYALPNNWTCIINVTKTVSSKSSYTNAKVNTLLALELPDSIDYGIAAPLFVSNEKVAIISNAGNVAMNLSLTAYAQTIGDNLSMYCPNGTINNISLQDQRYNLTLSNPGQMILSEFQSLYSPLEQDTTIKEFNLNPRQNDLTNDATKNSYWRIYLPEGVTGSCSGNLIFGAVNSPET